MFFGRTKELDHLRRTLFSDDKSAVMLYGRRRVGKSTLILEAVKDADCKVIYYECIMTSLEDNVKNLESKIRDVYDNKYLHFANLEDIFEFLGSTREKVILIIDEYCYLKTLSDRRGVDSLFQRIIDQMKNNISLVLLGSFVGMMKELLEKENPLFGRFDLIMKVQEFDYLESAKFYPDCSVRQKVEFYSVFGGSPFACRFIDPSLSLEENICNLLLNQFGVLHTYVESTLLSELSKVSNANIIFSALANGKMRYSELESSLNMKSNGGLDKQLKVLMELDVIRKTVPINKKKDKKKTFYEISDNMIRFYYRFIYANNDVIMRIGEKAFYKRVIAPMLTAYISPRFEDIAREYFSRRSREDENLEIYDIGTFWYDLPKEKKNGEFDCVVEHADSYSVYEVKYYEHPMGKAEIIREIEQVKALSELMKVRKIGFICLAGFEYEDPSIDFIDGAMLY